MRYDPTHDELHRRYQQEAPTPQAKAYYLNKLKGRARNGSKYCAELVRLIESSK